MDQATPLRLFGYSRCGLVANAVLANNAALLGWKSPAIWLLAIAVPLHTRYSYTPVLFHWSSNERLGGSLGDICTVTPSERNHCVDVLVTNALSWPIQVFLASLSALLLMKEPKEQ